MSASPIIVPFRCRSDNIGVVIHDPQSRATLAIDAPDADAVADVIDERAWRLTDLLITHHHGDHVAGIPALTSRFGCRVVGPAREGGRIDGLTMPVEPGASLRVGTMAVDVIDLAGHTAGQIGYYFADAATVFAADCLFENGCGRILEGTPEMMWAGLCRLAALPDETAVFFGHDYALANGRFAMTLEPQNPRLAAALAEAATDADMGRLRSHTTIGREKATNPFLRAHLPDLARAVGLEGAEPLAVFTEMRRRKNTS